MNAVTGSFQLGMSIVNDGQQSSNLAWLFDDRPPRGDNPINHNNRDINDTWAQVVSDYNPLSYASNVTRDLVQGGLTWSAFASAYAVIGLMTIVTFAATLYQFSKVLS
ncbi:MAG: hypothetical protein NTX46_01130 [Chloroflexi bacterium]|nr:hypothetical protein [Chloroflexota bacterium]